MAHRTVPSQLVAAMAMLVLMIACGSPVPLHEADSVVSPDAVAPDDRPTVAAVGAAIAGEAVPGDDAAAPDPAGDTAEVPPTAGELNPPPATPAPTPQSTLPPGVARPAWLHTRPLQVGPDGQALPAPTPEELVVRRIPTIDRLPPPTGEAFEAVVSTMPPEVVARSTWTDACPVVLEELRYLTLSFWGFDERPHTGEMIVNASWADEVVEIFRALFAARYPIEEMRVVAAEELEGTPTGDTNNTSAFVCRPVRGSTSWSQHAYGLAIDVNPFINPYQKGDRILPELAGAYLDRSHVRPGMLADGHPVVQAFDAIGWGWGGRWDSLTDWMHFSANNR